MMGAPKFVLDNFKISTQRQWRHAKRDELRAVIKMMGILRRGSAFTPLGPNGESVSKIDDQLETLREAWSPKNWGA